MGIWTLGINHKTASVAVRERVSFDPAQMPAVLTEVKSLKPISEVVILSTCNRTEIYYSAPEQLDPSALVTWLADYHKLDRQQIEHALYYLQTDQAVQHAMRVASGLDSLVLGEPQIFGQIDRKSTRLNSSHVRISYAVFCLKKKKKKYKNHTDSV